MSVKASGQVKVRPLQLRSDRDLGRFVRSLLERHGVKSPPVPVDRLVVDLGAVLQAHAFKGADSTRLRGFYVSEPEILRRPLIWVNTAYHRNIQRWSIAHEIAHLLLDRKALHVELGSTVDRGWKESAQSTDPTERRAQQIAAELLMPRFLLVPDFKSHPINPEDDEALKGLASRYQVSLYALVARLNQLGLAPPFL